MRRADLGLRPACRVVLFSSAAVHAVDLFPSSLDLRRKRCESCPFSNLVKVARPSPPKGVCIIGTEGISDGR